MTTPNPNVPPAQYASSITPRPIPVSTLFPGSQTPRDSAFLSQKNMDMKQTQLANIAKGGAVADKVIIPNLRVDYPNAGDITNTHVKVTQALMQNQANSQFDANVKKTGGSSCSATTQWGCYSGGGSRKSRQRHRHRHRQRHKRTRTRRHKGTRRTRRKRHY